METTFIVNPGSTSRKYALHKNGVCVVLVLFEQTGGGFCMEVHRNNTKVSQTDVSASDYTHSLERTVALLVDEKYVSSEEELSSVGVRVVAPGSYFTTHRCIDKKYVQKLKEVEEVAPLHIPGLLTEIRAVLKALPDAQVVGVSDSAFHITIPDYVSTISIPRTDAERFDIKRFGYHGLSFSSVQRKLISLFDEVPSRVIVCHIGGGVSIGALQDGKSVGTSMGYSPASGLIMGSRGGDVTGGVVAALTIQKRLRGKKLYEYLYKEAGFQGVAGVRDLRLVLDRASSEDENAKLALAMFAHQVQGWIATHAVHMGGVDAVVMTATAAERNPVVRSLLLSNLALLGIEFSVEKNDALIGGEGLIHTEESSVKIAVMKTDEMGEIERVVQEMVNK